MTIQAVTAQSTTRSLLPVYTGRKMQFIFWDATKLSSTIKTYSNLERKQHLGEGATFTVDLYRETDSTEEKPAFVAIKTAKLSEESYTSGGPGVDLYSLLLEIQILQYEPLQKHPNIINFLGMDWTLSGNRVPTPRIIVEYAKFGTLSSYLQGNPIHMNEKLELCLDIASGLQMIHTCGLVHGDLKLDNILVFEEDGGGRIAKISDFGCALTGSELEEGRRYRGTREYIAPELEGGLALRIEDLQRCDVFAFGLCLWEILKNGRRYLESSTTFPHDEFTSSGGRTLPELFDEFLEITYPDSRAAPSWPDTPMTPQVRLQPRKAELVERTQEPAKNAFRDLVHNAISPIAAKRNTMGSIVNILQR